MGQFQYRGDYYAEIGNFLREKYLEYGFTRGTKQEVDFLVEALELKPGMKVLDIGCGPGRHSLELARRGILATGIDISSGFIEIAQKVASKERLPATFLVADARTLAFDSEFDAAICLCEGAFGLVGPEESHTRVLRNIHHALKLGSPFAMTVINALAAARHATIKHFDAYTCTYVERETISNLANEQKEYEFFTTAFTARELRWMLERECFLVEGLYGCTIGNFARRKLSLEDCEIMAIARRS